MKLILVRMTNCDTTDPVAEMKALINCRRLIAAIHLLFEPGLGRVKRSVFVEQTIGHVFGIHVMMTLKLVADSDKPGIANNLKLLDGYLVAVGLDNKHGTALGRFAEEYLDGRAVVAQIIMHHVVPVR